MTENKKTIRIEFNEQSKGVTASVKIETTGDDLDNEELLQEAKTLYEKASKFSAEQTMKKLIRG